MKLQDIINALNLTVRCCQDRIDKEVGQGYVGDLLSDVMANSTEGDIWITRQVHPNIIAVAALKEHAAIVLIQGANAMDETIEKACHEGIPIIESDLSAFEMAGRLYRLFHP